MPPSNAMDGRSARGIREAVESPWQDRQMPISFISRPFVLGTRQFWPFPVAAICPLCLGLQGSSLPAQTSRMDLLDPKSSHITGCGLSTSGVRRRRRYRHGAGKGKKVTNRSYPCWKSFPAALARETNCSRAVLHEVDLAKFTPKRPALPLALRRSTGHRSVLNEVGPILAGGGLEPQPT